MSQEKSDWQMSMKLLAADIAAWREAYAQALVRIGNDPAGQKELRAAVERLQQRQATLHAEALAILSKAGFTPAAFRLIGEETERLARECGGDITDEDLEHSKLGRLIAGVRASGFDDGGEA
jgi:hypothetical protein